MTPPARWRSGPRPRGPRAPGVVSGLRALRDLPGLYDAAAARYGTRWLLRVPERDWLITSEPSDARELLAAPPEVALAGEASASLRPVGGERSVVLLDGDEHLRARRVLLPPFHGDRMRAYVRDMEELTDEALAGWTAGATVNVYDQARRLTFAIILRTVLGIRDRARADELAARIRKLFGGSALVIYVPWLQRDLGPLSPWRRFLALRKRADELIRAEIRAAREASAGGRRDDVLALLVAARGEDGAPLGDDEIRDQLVTALLAGHETTAAAIAWTVDLLAREPAARARLRDELAAGGDDYLRATIQEGLRMRPPVPMFGRVLAEPLALGPYAVPAGVAVGVSTWSMHRRPQLFPEPEAFRPERFLDGQPAAHAYLPFGGGVRRCLAASFAEQELRVVLGRIFTRFDVEPARTRPERARLRGVTLVPSPGVPVRVA